MKNYSIVRIGNEYVVQADEKSVLKVGSRRRAARLVTDAAELLDSQAAPSIVPVVDTGHHSPVIPGLLCDPRDNT
jgi:hypothetical protein